MSRLGVSKWKTSQQQQWFNRKTPKSPDVIQNDWFIKNEFGTYFHARYLWFIYVLLRNFETYPIRCLSDVWPGEIPQIQGVFFFCFPAKNRLCNSHDHSSQGKWSISKQSFWSKLDRIELTDVRMYGNHFGLQPVKFNSEFIP